LFLQLRKLNDNRKSLNQKITLGLATREELMKQIKVELNILDMCQLKIDVRLPMSVDIISIIIINIIIFLL